MDPAKVIGKRIKRLRKLRGWSQHDLAANAGMTNATISRLEAGENTPRHKTALALASALEVDVTELVGDDQEQEDRLARIESKLDRLLSALDADDVPVQLPPPPPELLRQSRRPKRESQ